MHRITLMSKPDCKLCDSARRVIDLVIGRHVAALIEEVDITQDPELLEKYRNDVPVVLVDDIERFRHTIDPDKLALLFFDEPGERLVGLE